MGVRVKSYSVLAAQSADKPDMQFRLQGSPGPGLYWQQNGNWARLAS